MIINNNNKFEDNFKKSFKNYDDYQYNDDNETECENVEFSSIRNCKAKSDLTLGLRCCYVYDINNINNSKCFAINETKKKDFLNEIKNFGENFKYIVNCYQEISINSIYNGKKGFDCENKINVTSKENCTNDKNLIDKKFKCCYVNFNDQENNEEKNKNYNYCVPIKKNKQNDLKNELKNYYFNIEIDCFSIYLSNFLILFLILIF